MPRVRFGTARSRRGTTSRPFFGRIGGQHDWWRWSSAAGDAAEAGQGRVVMGGDGEAAGGPDVQADHVVVGGDVAIDRSEGGGPAIATEAGHGCGLQDDRRVDAGEPGGGEGDEAAVMGQVGDVGGEIEVGVEHALHGVGLDIAAEQDAPVRGADGQDDGGIVVVIEVDVGRRPNGVEGDVTEGAAPAGGDGLMGDVVPIEPIDEMGGGGPGFGAGIIEEGLGEQDAANAEGFDQFDGAAEMIEIGMGEDEGVDAADVEGAEGGADGVGDDIGEERGAAVEDEGLAAAFDEVTGAGADGEHGDGGGLGLIVGRGGRARQEEPDGAEDEAADGGGASAGEPTGEDEHDDQECGDGPGEGGGEKHHPRSGEIGGAVDDPLGGLGEPDEGDGDDLAGGGPEAGDDHLEQAQPEHGGDEREHEGGQEDGGGTDQVEVVGDERHGDEPGDDADGEIADDEAAESGGGMRGEGRERIEGAHDAGDEGHERGDDAEAELEAGIVQVVGSP